MINISLSLINDSMLMYIINMDYSVKTVTFLLTLKSNKIIYPLMFDLISLLNYEQVEKICL